MPEINLLLSIKVTILFTIDIDTNIARQKNNCCRFMNAWNTGK